MSYISKNSSTVMSYISKNSSTVMSSPQQ
jgi:hypothetical protein